MSTDAPLLNVAAWADRSVANGPGTRFVVWLQGCPILCPGCVNQDFLPLEPRHLMTPDELGDRVLAVEGIEGVTFSGGEPTVQAHGLSVLGERLQANGLTVVCYSGYTLEDLRGQRDPWVDRLLDTVDLLIDGPYVRNEASSVHWRGSTNQRVHALSSAYDEASADVDARPAQVELILREDGFLATGTWPAGLVERLNAVLRNGS